MNVRISVLATLVMVFVSNHPASANDRSASTRLVASACATVASDGVEQPTPYATCTSDRTDWMQRIRRTLYSPLQACFTPLVPASKIAEVLE